MREQTILEKLLEKFLILCELLVPHWLQLRILNRFYHLAADQKIEAGLDPDNVSIDDLYEQWRKLNE